MRSRDTRVRIAVVLAACLAAPVAWGQVAAQQAAPLPDASEIIRKHVAAIGGATAFKAITSLRARGTFELTAQGVSGTIEIISSRPARLRVKVDVPGVGLIETCYDGKNGWEIDPVQGPSLLSGKRLTEMAEDAWFDATLHEADYVQSMTVVGREEFDRRPAYKVKVVTKSGSEQHEFFDVETSLQLGMETTRLSPLSPNPLPFTAVMRDYRKFGDVLQPTTHLQRTLGLEQVVRLTSIDYNTVTDADFEPPPAVKALIK